LQSAVCDLQKSIATALGNLSSSIASLTTGNYATKGDLESAVTQIDGRITVLSYLVYASLALTAAIGLAAVALSLKRKNASSG